MKNGTPVRCAIYTRVSTDHGLEQDFNSLDAQHDAAQAYIRSQAHAGWTLIRTRYADGGYSGGSTERPALQRLLADVRARKVDVINVSGVANRELFRPGDRYVEAFEHQETRRGRAARWQAARSPSRHFPRSCVGKGKRAALGFGTVPAPRLPAPVKAQQLCCGVSVPSSESHRVSQGSN